MMDDENDGGTDNGDVNGDSGDEVCKEAHEDDYTWQC